MIHNTPVTLTQHSLAGLLALAVFGCGATQPAHSAADAEVPAAAQPADTEVEAPAEEAATTADAMAAGLAGATRIEGVGFETPESVRYWAAEDLYLVSNIAGGPLDLDDNGFISKVSPDGTVAELKFIDGAAQDVELNAPKGMGVWEDRLFVTDIDTVRVFDLKTGASLANIQVPGATFLNDIAVAPDGTVYVSDTGLTTDGQGGLAPAGTDAVYRVDAEGMVEALVSGVELGLPNGLSASNEGVQVVTWSGKWMNLDKQGARSAEMQAPAAELDGIEQLPDGRVLISSWKGAALYIGEPGGPLQVLVSGLKSPADIGVDSKRAAVLIPLFQDNAVLIQPLPSLPEAQ